MDVGGEAHFEETLFQRKTGAANFQEARIGGGAYFNGSKFSGYARDCPEFR
jgi:hypothetical protein